MQLVILLCSNARQRLHAIRQVGRVPTVKSEQDFWSRLLRDFAWEYQLSILFVVSATDEAILVGTSPLNHQER